MFQIDRKLALRALDLAATTVERRGSMPILSTAKVWSAGAGRPVVIETTELDNTMSIALPAEVAGYGSCSLPDPRTVRAALAAVGGDRVTITPRDGAHGAVVAAGRMTLTLTGLPVQDYPTFDRVAEAEFSADLGEAEFAQLARLLPAISSEETRYYLNGINVRKVGDWLYQFVATDGHRLHVADIPLPNATGAIPDNTIIPRGWLQIALGRFAKAKQGARLTYGPLLLTNEQSQTLAPDNRMARRIALSAGMDGLDATLTGKLIDGTYPDYTRVIPAGLPYAARFKRAELVSALQALSPFSESKRTRAFHFDFSEGGMRIGLRSPDLGEGFVDVAAEHNLPRDFECGFNGRYLLEAFAVLHGDEVEMQFGRREEGGAYWSPTLIRDPAETHFFTVLMPMRA
jgi:DNA polymerase-3 subunit beta